MSDFFFNNVPGLRPTISLEKRLRPRCFPMNLAKFKAYFFLNSTFGGYFFIASKEGLQPNNDHLLKVTFSD